jgi:hypothetical protein
MCLPLLLAATKKRSLSHCPNDALYPRDRQSAFSDPSSPFNRLHLYYVKIHHDYFLVLQIRHMTRKPTII